MNDGYEYGEQVGADAAGRTVAAHLALRHRHSSAEVWRARIAAGEVLVDGEAAVASTPLRAGQIVVWRRPPWEEPAVPLAFAVLFRDAHLLAVAKPRGLPTMPAVVLFARTDQARRGIAKAWRSGAVVKGYRALVTGVPSREAFDVDTPIGLVDHPRLGRVYAAVAEGKLSLTHVRVRAARDGQALVEATIPTGRPHQIRIHLAAAGHPLVGDPLYAAGGGLRSRPALPGECGYRLHAYRLSLDHPVTGARVEIECGPPLELAIA